jgi:hypothetical protein
MSMFHATMPAAIIAKARFSGSRSPLRSTSRQMTRFAIAALSGTRAWYGMRIPLDCPVAPADSQAKSRL